MNNLKFPRLISASLLILTLGNIANAAPVTYTGSKGQYTVDKDAGTYKGCRFKQSCILLGPKEKIGPTSWKNGEHTYSINGSTIHVYEKNKEIFQDSFVNTPTSVGKPTTPEVKYGLITPKCIGSACLGMTLRQLKAKLGKKVKYISEQHLSNDAIEVIQDGKVQFYICYDNREDLEDHLRKAMDRDKKKIKFLSTDNSYYRTKESVGPGTSVVKAEKVYGKASVSYNEGHEIVESLEFSKLPKGYNDMWFRTKVKSGEFAGIYPKSSGKDKNNFSIYTAKKIKPDAYISEIMIHY